MNAIRLLLVSILSVFLLGCGLAGVDDTSRETTEPEDSQSATGTEGESVNDPSASPGERIGKVAELDLGFAIERLDATPDGRYVLVTSDMDSSATVWDRESQSAVFSIPIGDGIIDPVAISFDGRFVGHFQGSPGAMTVEIHAKGDNKPVFSRRYRFLFTPMHCLDASPSKSEFAFGENRNICIVDPTQPDSEQTIDNGDVVGCVEYSPDGTLLAVGTGSGSVRIWDTDKWEVQTRMSISGRPVKDVSVSADNRLVAARRGSGIVVREVATGEIVQTFEDVGLARSLTFLGNSLLAHTRSPDEIRILDCESGAELKVFKVAGPSVYRPDLAVSEIGELFFGGPTLTVLADHKRKP